MFYLDTSVLVVALTVEAETRAVQQWLDQVSDDVRISDWTAAEFHAALGRKLRMKRIRPRQAERIAALFEQSFVSRRKCVQVGRADFRRAGELARSSATALKAGDALHLALAERASATLASLDGDQARAAATLLGRSLLLPQPVASK